MNTFKSWKLKDCQFSSCSIFFAYYILWTTKQRKFNVHTHVLLYFLLVYHMNNETKKFKTHTHIPNNQNQSYKLFEKTTKKASAYLSKVEDGLKMKYILKKLKELLSRRDDAYCSNCLLLLHKASSLPRQKFLYISSNAPLFPWATPPLQQESTHTHTHTHTYIWTCLLLFLYCLNYLSHTSLILV